MDRDRMVAPTLSAPVSDCSLEPRTGPGGRAGQLTDRGPLALGLAVPGCDLVHHDLQPVHLQGAGPVLCPGLDEHGPGKHHALPEPEVQGGEPQPGVRPCLLAPPLPQD